MSEQRITSDKMEYFVEIHAKGPSPEDICIAVEETTGLQIQGMDNETFELLVDIPRNAIVSWL